MLFGRRDYESKIRKQYAQEQRDRGRQTLSALPKFNDHEVLLLMPFLDPNQQLDNGPWYTAPRATYKEARAFYKQHGQVQADALLREAKRQYDYKVDAWVRWLS
jgi:hypothetical protein